MKPKSKFLCGIILFGACIGTSPPLQTATASEALTIGIVHREDFAYAPMMKNSYEMALAAINKAGGIKGRSVKLVYANDQGDRYTGEQVVKDLVKKSGAVMLIGGYSSSNTLYMARMADRLNMPFLVSTAADDRITQRNMKNIYRLNPPASEYAKGLEDFLLKKIMPKSMAIVYENSPYGTGSALRMMWFCRENDIQIRAIIPYHKERAKPDYFQKILAPLTEDSPEVIYMVSYLKDATVLVKKLRELKIRAVLCGGAGGFTHQKFISISADAADYVLTATLWSPQSGYPGTKDYFEHYTRKYAMSPDYHGAEAFAAMLVAADALKRAESLRPESVRRALDASDMDTPFGPVKFTVYGNFERQNRLPTLVFQVINGKFETIWPRELATETFVRPPDWRRSQ